MKTTALRVVSAAVFIAGLHSYASAQEITPPASAVTASTNDGNLPANVVDNNLATRWSANGDGQWLQLDLGIVRSVGSVSVAVYNGSSRQNIFDLQVSAGGGIWTTVFSGRSSGTTTAEESYDFPDVDARWVRYLGHSATTSTFNSVTEISIFAGTVAATPTPTPATPPPVTPTPTPVPSAIELTPPGSGVSASTHDGNLPANTVDGSLASRWSANGDGQWIQYDLGAVQNVAYVRLAVYSGNSRQNRFDLQLSSGGGVWTNAITGGLTSGTTTALETHDFADAGARYVRYLGHGATTSPFNSLTEVEIWGSPCTSCPTPTPTPVRPTATPTPTATPNAGGFRHPGVINTRESLDFVKARIQAGAQPQTAAYNELLAHALASLSRNPTPYEVVQCGAYSNPNIGCTNERDDAAAAYAQALLWYFTGNTQRAQKAIQYMDAWSAVIKDHTDHNARLQTGWSGSNWTKAAEIIRHTNAGWSSTGISRFRSMLLNVYYPEIQNGAGGGINGNWELTMIDAMIGIGVFCDDKPIFDKAVAMWRRRVPAYIYITSDGAKPMPPPGTLSKTIEQYWYNPGRFVEGLGQETCRDLGHLTFGFASLLYTAETALIQGIDLYTEQSRRIRAGLEYNTRVQNGWAGDGICGGSVTRNMSETLELGHNHYVERRSFTMPNTLQFILSKRPTNRGHHIVWETMTHGDVGAVGVQ